MLCLFFMSPSTEGWFMHNTQTNHGPCSEQVSLLHHTFDTNPSFLVTGWHLSDNVQQKRHEKLRSKSSAWSIFALSNRSNIAFTLEWTISSLKKEDFTLVCDALPCTSFCFLFILLPKQNDTLCVKMWHDSFVESQLQFAAAEHRTFLRANGEERNEHPW